TAPAIPTRLGGTRASPATDRQTRVGGGTGRKPAPQAGTRTSLIHLGEHFPPQLRKNRRSPDPYIRKTLQAVPTPRRPEGMFVPNPRFPSSPGFPPKSGPSFPTATKPGGP